MAHRPLRHRLAQDGAELGLRSRALALLEERRGIEIGQKVDGDLLAGAPVGGDLQDRRARQAAMGEQHGLAEVHTAQPRHHLQRHAAQLGHFQGKRHQRWPRFGECQAKAAGDIVGFLVCLVMMRYGTQMVVDSAVLNFSLSASRSSIATAAS